jgi:hypothetical protein
MVRGGGRGEGRGGRSGIRERGGGRGGGRKGSDGTVTIYDAEMGKTMLRFKAHKTGGLTDFKWQGRREEEGRKEGGGREEGGKRRSNGTVTIHDAEREEGGGKGGEVGRGRRDLHFPQVSLQRAPPYHLRPGTGDKRVARAKPEKGGYHKCGTGRNRRWLASREYFFLKFFVWNFQICMIILEMPHLENVAFPNLVEVGISEFCKILA